LAYICETNQHKGLVPSTLNYFNGSWGYTSQREQASIEFRVTNSFEVKDLFYQAGTGRGECKALWFCFVFQ